MMNFQDMIAALSRFWADQGCVIALPYDLEVGAGTMCPETFLRVLGPQPWKVAYFQPSRRPADGRYGENPNRLLKHTQMQVILKPPPADVQDVYLLSLESLGVRLADHDIRFEEDNWEAPTLGAWGTGWQVMLDGLEITQFTYFQQCGGLDLNPISAEITYGLERIAAFLQNVPSIYDIRWSNEHSYGEMRLQEELELSVYDFEAASPEACQTLLDTYEAEALRLLASYKDLKGSRAAQMRFPLRKVYELCLKCSHLFNILDARGAISVTERVALIARIRKMATQVARIYVGRLNPEPIETVVEAQPA
ncbi:MAG TPA: glycine--tRNA ligase subunit alpha [Terriglobia bacterium]|jgi:glycyl-tRNA synthetase alpha chain|nr:glycine--tRNA ligase subunit alpha [Terriglobia bacterium]